MAVQFSNAAVKFYRRAHPLLQQAIKAVAARVAQNPLLGKPLKGKLTGTRRVKFPSPVTSQRLVMVYEVSGDDLRVLAIDYRDRIYRKLEQSGSL